jgi:hypothetical protein
MTPYTRSSQNFPFPGWISADPARTPSAPSLPPWGTKRSGSSNVTPHGRSAYRIYAKRGMWGAPVGVTLRTASNTYAKHGNRCAHR